MFSVGWEVVVVRWWVVGSEVWWVCGVDGRAFLAFFFFVVRLEGVKCFYVG